MRKGLEVGKSEMEQNGKKKKLRKGLYACQYQIYYVWMARVTWSVENQISPTCYRCLIAHMCGMWIAHTTDGCLHI